MELELKLNSEIKVLEINIPYASNQEIKTNSSESRGEIPPFLMLSLWNSTLKLIISQTTMTKTMKQICADHSQIDFANITKGPFHFFWFFFPFFCSHAISGKYHALKSAFQALIASYCL